MNHEKLLAGRNRAAGTGIVLSSPTSLARSFDVFSHHRNGPMDKKTRVTIFLNLVKATLQALGISKKLNNLSRKLSGVRVFLNHIVARKIMQILELLNFILTSAKQSGV